MVEPSSNRVNSYALTAEEAASQLGVEIAKGLSGAEAQKRLQQYGPNQLDEKKKEPGWQAFLRMEYVFELEIRGVDV